MANQTLSTLYAGGGTSGAVKALTTTRTVALSAGDTIDIRNCVYLDVWLANVSASKTGTLTCVEYTSTSPTESNACAVHEATIASTDHTTTANKKAFGLASAVAYSKAPVTFTVSQGESAKLAMAAVGGGTFFARYTKRVV